MTTLTGGQALVQSLRIEGVEVIFALPGVQLDWAFDALYEVRDSIRVIHTRHEQATAYMADGYARVTGRPGVCFVVPGPGFAQHDGGAVHRLRLFLPGPLCLTGQIQSELIGKGRGVLHEIPDQLQVMASVTKWARRAESPAQIPGLVHDAFRQLGTGRPRPVEFGEIPPDILATRGEGSFGRT